MRHSLRSGGRILLAFSSTDFSKVVRGEQAPQTTIGSCFISPLGLQLETPPRTDAVTYLDAGPFINITGRMLPLLREMRKAVEVPLAAQPGAFRTTDECHCFTRQPAFPDDLEIIQVSRKEFTEFGRWSRAEGLGYVGGCCVSTAGVFLVPGLVSQLSVNAKKTMLTR